MVNKSNNTMKDLNRLLARQNFKDEKEMQDFLNGLTGKPLDLPPMELTNEEQAQDLVLEAYELSSAKAKQNIAKALQLDPDCIEAYEYMAAHKKKFENILELLDKGIAIGRKKFGGKFLKKHKGEFWGWHETRPFMRCLLHKVEILGYQEKYDESIQIMEEMLELNQGDNQGVRYNLLSTLIIQNDLEKFRKYDSMFADEKSTHMLYSRALFTFKTEGDTPNSSTMLQKAFQTNPFVAQKIFNPKLILTPGSYMIGSPEEADDYLFHAFAAWTEEETFKWFINTIDKIMKKILQIQSGAGKPLTKGKKGTGKKGQ